MQMEPIDGLLRQLGLARCPDAGWKDGRCTNCGGVAVTTTVADGYKLVIETPRCPSCGSFMKHFDSDGDKPTSEEPTEV